MHNSQATQIQTSHVRKSKQGFLFACFCLIASSCVYPVYEKYQAVEQGVWDKDSVYHFSFEIADASVPYDLIMEIRNNNQYPFQNLWLLGQTVYPDSTMRRDTIEYMLADDYGNWYGNGISIYQLSLPLRERFFFPERGTYTFGFRQGMRKDKLPGIEGIGLRVESSR